MIESKTEEQKEIEQNRIYSIVYSALIQYLHPAEFTNEELQGLACGLRKDNQILMSFCHDVADFAVTRFRSYQYDRERL